MMMMMMIVYDRADVYYNLMVWSTFTTIHMNVLCDDGYIIIENDNAGGMLFLWFVYFYYHNYCMRWCANVNNNNENVGNIRRVEIMLWSCVYRYYEVYYNNVRLSWWWVCYNWEWCTDCKSDIE